MTVERRPLGSTGIQVSAVGVGAMQFGHADWKGAPGDEECGRIVDAAIELGATFIDTAPAYGSGESEAILGRVLEGRRQEVVLCTKMGHWADGFSDFSADRIEESVEESLRRLRTDYLDVVLIHSPPVAVMDPDQSHFRVLQRLVDGGVIRAYGVSGRDDTSDEILKIIDTGSRVVEMRFNALYQEPARAFRQAYDAGVGIIVKVPMESGWLSGRYDGGSAFDEARGRWTPDQIVERAGLVEEFNALLPAGISTPVGSLSHILSRPEVSTVIPGTRTVEQLRANVEASTVRLPEETLDQIGRLGETQKSLPW